MKAENRAIIEVLLQYGADPNKQENYEVGKNTPMHLAAERNMIQVIDQFVGCGGDVTLQNKQGFTCLHIAAKEGHADMCKLLVARGCPPEVRD